jgi:ubiquinone/menaquinone biosynthesis C-methylase UbiE
MLVSLRYQALAGINSRMQEGNKPKLIYTQIIAKNYEKNRQSNLGDIAFWKKEQQELQYGIGASALNIHEVLEAGCGTGRFIPDIAGKGYVVLGLDLSHHMLGMARRKIKEKQFNCNLIRADISNIPFNNFKADFVYCIRVMNQLPSREYAFNTIKELCRICKTPGAILLEYVNSWSLSRASSKSSTLLSIRDVQKILHRERNCRIVYVHGILFFSQTLWTRLPRLLLHPIVELDSLLCRLLPMFSTRCYVLVKKGEL